MLDQPPERDRPKKRKFVVAIYKFDPYSKEPDPELIPVDDRRDTITFEFGDVLEAGTRDVGYLSEFLCEGICLNFDFHTPNVYTHYYDLDSNEDCDRDDEPSDRLEFTANGMGDDLVYYKGEVVGKIRQVIGVGLRVMNFLESLGIYNDECVFDLYIGDRRVERVYGLNTARKRFDDLFAR